MKTLSTLFVFFTLLLLAQPAKADHVMGSDIRWECLGNDSFKITVTAYRDCNGSSLTAGGIYLINQCQGQSQALGGTKSQAIDITPTCDNSCTRCSNPSCTDTRFGIQQYELTTYMKIDRTKCCKWKITWGLCCRSSAINTGAANKNFHNEAFLDICAGDCNSSPYFSKPPQMIFCKDQCVTYDPGVRDDDTVAGLKDSLVYKLGKPLETSGTAIPYSPGYDYDEPLSYNGDPDKNAVWEPNCEGFHLDPQTGILRFKPTKEETSVLVYVIEEWRKDSTGKPVLISETRRDVEIAVVDCQQNYMPSIVSEKYSYTFCTNRMSCFDLNTFDLDKTDSLTLSTFVGHIPGATFVSDSGKKWPKGKFCWKPTDKDVRSLPYTFVAKVNDDACPMPGTGTKVYNIYVKQAPAAEVKINKIDSCGTYSFLAIPDPIVAIDKYNWKVEAPFGDSIVSQDSAFTYRYKYAGTYKLSVTVTTAGGCRTTYTDSVVVPPVFRVELPHDSVICRRTFSIPSQVYNGKAPYKYEWSTGDTGVTTLSDIDVDRDTFFIVTVTDANGCAVRDSMHLSVMPGTGPTGSIDVKQVGCNLYDFNAVADSPSDVVEYLWEGDVPFGDRPIWFKGQTFSYTYSDTGTYEIRLTMTSASGCKTTYTDKVQRYHPDATFTTDSIDIRTYKFIPAQTNAKKYEWFFDDGDTSLAMSPTHTYTSGGQFEVILKMTDSFNCIAFDTQTINIIITSLTEDEQGTWKIYPNPINGNKLIVEAPQPLEGEVRIMLFDAKGRRVLEVDKVREQRTMITLPENMQPGTYLIKIQGDSVYSTEVLVK